MRASSRTTKVRTKVLAAFVSMAMACGMVAALPSLSTALSLNSDSVTAYADEPYEIDIVGQLPVEVTAGNQVNLTSWVSEAYPNTHYDFKVTSGTAYGQVNKHSGQFTGTAAGSCTVTVYLVDGDAPTKNPNNPDGTVLAQVDLPVNVSATSDYGFQGKKLAIKMNNPGVQSYMGSDVAGYTNELGALVPVNGKLSFTFEMTHGFNSYNSPSGFAELNNGNLLLETDEGKIVATLSTRNTGALTITAVNNSTKTVTAQVNTSGLSAGTYKLVYLSSFRANNPANTLGTTVSFRFTI